MPTNGIDTFIFIFINHILLKPDTSDRIFIVPVLSFLHPLTAYS